MEEWATYKLGEIAECSLGKMLDQRKNKGKPRTYLGNVAVRWGSFNIDPTQTMLFEDHELEKYSLKKNDIVICEGGEPGRCAIWKSNDTILIQKALHRVRVNTEIADPLYVYYYISHLAKSHLLEPLFTGSTIKHLPRERLVSIDIRLPDLSTQKQISSILAVIDDKRHTNSLINDNLEQQASSLLSDWISTYPCRTYKLSDIGKYVSDKCDTGDLTSQNYISTENMLPNKKGIVDASNIPTGKVTCFKVDDILIANIRPYFQKIWKADISGGCSTDVLCIRSCVESHSPILYWILHQDAFFEYVMTGAKGCKMPRGDKQHIMNWTIDLPEPEYWADIATQLGAVDQRLAYNRVESINLSNLRDTLLPKLMSGELELNEIDC